MDTKQQKLNLKREVGLMGAVSLLAGTMMGAGIFMSPQTVISAIGSCGGSLVVWASCALQIIMVSLCFAELGTVIPESGGEYIYVLRTSGPVVAFILAFSSIMFLRPFNNAACALGFGQYAVALFHSDCHPSALEVKCAAAAAIIVLTYVNCLSVRASMSLQVVFLVGKVVALMLIIMGGLVMLFRGHTGSFEDAFENTNVDISSISVALYQGLWAYTDWNALNNVTEELKSPEVSRFRDQLTPAVPCTKLLWSWRASSAADGCRCMKELYHRSFLPKVAGIYDFHCSQQNQ
ncbi:b(0,+)-type amino acid transporter 1-like [Nothobranchius furzeri]|uniref:b(0,+)-type amino acid transporter 1-like n=1 Tax=Nothobranchius furzeri TaxID=105023 RepID=UPI003904DF82